MLYTSRAEKAKDTQEVKTTVGTSSSASPQDILTCSGACDQLPAQCYICNISNSCSYGSLVNTSCKVKQQFSCSGNRKVIKQVLCIYCFLTDSQTEHTCRQDNTTCNVALTPRQRVRAVCTVNDEVFCLGKRTFTKLVDCNWTSGYRWSTALILSVTLGGFGGDRFYLGYWKEGLGKLFSFGGLGVWTIIDIVLIGTTFLPPADGSLYIL